MPTLTKPKAVEILQEAGFKTADTWSLERLAKRLGHLPNVVDLDDKGEPKVAKKLRDDVAALLKAIEDEEEIKVVETDDEAQDEADANEAAAAADGGDDKGETAEETQEADETPAETEETPETAEETQEADEKSEGAPAKAEKSDEKGKGKKGKKGKGKKDKKSKAKAAEEPKADGKESKTDEGDSGKTPATKAPAKPRTLKLKGTEHYVAGQAYARYGVEDGPTENVEKWIRKTYKGNNPGRTSFIRAALSAIHGYLGNEFKASRNYHAGKVVKAMGLEGDEGVHADAIKAVNEAAGKQNDGESRTSLVIAKRAIAGYLSGKKKD